MLGFLIGLIDPISKITKAIADAKIAATNATTEQARIAAEERVKIMESRRAVLVAESGSKINAIMRVLIASGPALYLSKIFIWDKVLGLGSTDPLSPELWQIVMAVVGFYFLFETARIFRK